MDDNEHVCPLCCEELDISDRQFFPCKCGYQVCMWCWHRIRESESGLCPACRTPYGDDPHEFSAVDVEEVLKANKEKEAAAKRERQRQQNDGNSSDGEGIAALMNGNLKGQMEVPKDRTQLANMRVIRRNLVYAVGLPPSIASEDTLRKADYFGQYGKISKIVLNRSQTTGGDLRRASASAYVTFFHKEDTLACILALDGFYMDGRNIRASYGTSKYCSAFIKNVRCNNPECTYLHQMGDVEDTFTKQEIQAGYVTSGRDVLARQQQIVQQALSAASGAAGSTPRHRTGGGGPSGTGRASSNPVFPAPTFDEPAKPSSTPLVPPPSSSHTRAVTIGSGFPPISAAAAAGTPAPNKIGRASSVGTGVPANGFPGLAKGSIGSAAQVARKGVISAAGLPPSSNGPHGATAASVVAGVHSVSGSSEPPAPHTTLTPLTPLKRSSTSKSGPKTSTDSGTDLKSLNSPGSTNMATKLTSLKAGGRKNGIKVSGVSAAAAASENPSNSGKIAGIGGSVIAAPVALPPTAVGGAASLNKPGGNLPAGPNTIAGLGDGLGGLGGEVFNGPLKSSGAKSAIGSGKDKWNSNSIGGDPVLSNRSGGLWHSSGAPLNNPAGNGRQVGGGVIGGGPIGGGFNSGSSALASMLGINLPTGSGSLRESPNLWGAPAPSGPGPIAALNGSSVPVHGVLGGNGAPNPGNGLIGGVAIGGPPPMSAGQIGAGGSKNDIALLQSLLPGVHITSGGSYNQGGGFGTIGGAGGGNDWNSAPGVNQQQRNSGVHLGQPGPQWDNGGLQSSLGGAPVGAIGQGGSKQNQSQAPGSIW